MPEQIPCRVQGCNFGPDGSVYMSHPECTTYMARRDLTYNFNVVHGGVAEMRRVKNETRTEKEKVQAKLDRPSIKNHATDIEWTLFEAKWERYVEASRLEDLALINQFWACLDIQTETELVHKGLAREKDLQILINEVKDLVLEKRNKLVQRYEFSHVKQEKDEKVSKYLATLQGKAELCQFSSNSKCPES